MIRDVFQRHRQGCRSPAVSLLRSCVPRHCSAVPHPAQALTVGFSQVPSASLVSLAVCTPLPPARGCMLSHHEILVHGGGIVVAVTAAHRMRQVAAAGELICALFCLVFAAKHGPTVTARQ